MLNFFTKRNSFATLNKKVHYPMIDILDHYIPKNKIINILEIGAGNGLSTINFITQLNKNKYIYTYTVNEYYLSYKQDLINTMKLLDHLCLNKTINEDNILIMPFEDIYMHTTQKFDIILF